MGFKISGILKYRVDILIKGAMLQKYKKTKDGDVGHRLFSAMVCSFLKVVIAILPQVS